MKNVALITGASSGIGRELARIHAQSGGDLVIVARRIELLNELKLELTKEFGIEIEVLQQDLTQKNAAQTIFNFTQEKNQEILEDIKYFDISENKGTDRDVQIYFGSSKAKPLIKIRHDPYSDALGASLAIKCEIEGKNSRLGSLVSFGTGTNSPGSTGFTDLWARVDPTYAKMLATSFQKGTLAYKKGIDELNKEYMKKIGTTKTGVQLKAELKKVACPDSLINEIIKSNGGFNYEKKIGLTSLQIIKGLKPTLYEAYQNERILLSVTHIVSSFEGLIRDYFTEGKKVKDVTQANVTQKDINLQIRKNNVIMEIYKYASAMSPSSGRYVITK